MACDGSQCFHTANVLKQSIESQSASHDGSGSTVKDVHALISMVLVIRHYKSFIVTQDTSAEEHSLLSRLPNNSETKYLHLPLLLSAAHLLASVPDPQSAPASLDTAENSEDSCSQNDSNAPQETENTHFALCLVHFLKCSALF